MLLVNVVLGFFLTTGLGEIRLTWENDVAHSWVCESCDFVCVKYLVYLLIIVRESLYHLARCLEVLVILPPASYNDLRTFFDAYVIHLDSHLYANAYILA